NGIRVAVVLRDRYKQLNIGTQIFNGLVTAYMDTNAIHQKIHLGPTYNDDDLEECQIYIKKSVVEGLHKESIDIREDRDIFQLRQLRSQFHDMSTYLRLCSWGSVLGARNLRPATIWTLHLFPTQKRTASSQMNASTLFATLAKEVREKKEHATISRSFLEKQIIPIEKNESAINKLLKEIMTLFNDNNTLTIIGNEGLNKLLQKIAAILSGPITAQG
ncbi:hypothetical protein BGZ76_004389, partial [Entomortierella beljakovae]